MATMAAMAAPVAEIDVAIRGYHHIARAASAHTQTSQENSGN